MRPQADLPCAATATESALGSEFVYAVRHPSTAIQYTYDSSRETISLRRGDTGEKIAWRRLVPSGSGLASARAGAPSPCGFNAAWLPASPRASTGDRRWPTTRPRADRRTLRESRWARTTRFSNGRTSSASAATSYSKAVDAVGNGANAVEKHQRTDPAGAVEFGPTATRRPRHPPGAAR